MAARTGGWGHWVGKLEGGRGLEGRVVEWVEGMGWGHGRPPPPHYYLSRMCILSAAHIGSTLKNVATQVAEELKMVIYTYIYVYIYASHLLNDKCITPIQRGTQKEKGQ